MKILNTTCIPKHIDRGIIPVLGFRRVQGEGAPGVTWEGGEGRGVETGGGYIQSEKAVQYIYSGVSYFGKSYRRK